MGLSFRRRPLHADSNLDMNNALRNGFPPFKDEESLRYAIDLVCAKYGKVKVLRIFPATMDSRGGGHQCLCLLQLDPPKAQAALRLELKVSTFSHELAFVADVDEKWSGPSM
jgi:hypothetical protein